MRHGLRLALLALIALALLPTAGTRAQSDTRCFNETGYCISGPIRQYWERNGGLPVFGFPITPLQTETVEGWTGPVQWFERDRLEDHTAQGQGVLAGRLGVERLGQQGRPWQFRPLGAPPQPGCRGFRETGYYMCGGFLAYWDRNGGLERFGFPITDQIVETLNGRDYTVQYFERRRMEFHPENRPPFDVLLGLLGREVREGVGPSVPVPTPTPIPVSQQIVIDEPADNATISSPIRVSGRTTRFPGGGTLAYRFYEPNGTELSRGTFAVDGAPGRAGGFSVYLDYRAPVGNTVLFELTDRDPTTNNVIARAQRTFRYQATTAQQIVLEQPRNGDRIGTRLTVQGRTTIYPSEGDLLLNVIDSRGLFIGSFIFGVSGMPGQPATFFAQYEIPNQGGRQITVEVVDVNARGDVQARTQVTVFAGSTRPYPVP